MMLKLLWQCFKCILPCVVSELLAQLRDTPSAHLFINELDVTLMLIGFYRGCRMPLEFRTLEIQERPHRKSGLHNFWFKPVYTNL